MNSTIIHKTNLYHGVKQFSVFLDKHHTSLNTLLNLIHTNKLTIIAFSSNETSEYLVLRIITNYSDNLRNFLSKKNIFFIEQRVLAAKFVYLDDISKIIDGITAAEIKIHYMYPMLPYYSNKIGIILGVEDIDLAAKAINGIGVEVITQNEIDR